MKKYRQKRCFEPPRQPLNKAKDLGILDGQWKSENSRFYVNKLMQNKQILNKGDQIDYLNNISVAKQYDVGAMYDKMVPQLQMLEAERSQMDLEIR